MDRGIGSLIGVGDQERAIGLAGGANKCPNAHRLELRRVRVKRIFGEARGVSERMVDLGGGDP
jgi:hypothetical protein